MAIAIALWQEGKTMTNETTNETRTQDAARGFRQMTEAYKRRMREEYDTEALRTASTSAVLSQEARDYARSILAERGLEVTT